MGHRYPVRIGPQRDEARIREASQLLDDRIAEIQGRTGELNNLHLAVMAALSLADDVLAEREHRSRERSDEAAFRRTLRERSERLLSLVEAELVARKGPEPAAL